jgi:heme exporter protein D
MADAHVTRKFVWLAIGFLAFAFIGRSGLYVWLALNLLIFVYLVGKVAGHRGAMEALEQLAGEDQQHIAAQREAAHEGRQ